MKIFLTVHFALLAGGRVPLYLYSYGTSSANKNPSGNWNQEVSFN